MTGNGAEKSEQQLALRSRLSEMAQIPAWIEALASQHSIPAKIQFAINLCLEEAVSNVILHGYRGEADRSVIVRFTMPREGCFVFVVDDDAPRFNPLDQPELPALNPRAEIRIGGQGVRMMRRFADAVEYEQIPTGNRLRISFLTAGSGIPAE